MTTETEQRADEEQREDAPPAEAEEQQQATRALMPTHAAQEIRELVTWGKLMRASGYFRDAQSEAAAAVKILMGRALGFGMIQSMTGLHIVEGRPTIGANLMAHAVKQSGRYDYRVIEHTDDHCTIRFMERAGAAVDGKPQWMELGTSEFSLEDAGRAGLLKPNSNWEKWPRNMLFARALSNGVRWHCPDVFGGTAVYTPEELRPEMEITEDGEPVYIESHVVPPPEPEQPEPTGGSDRSSRRQQQGRTAAAQRGSGQTRGRQQREKYQPNDYSKVTDLQRLMTWAHEAYGKVQADVTRGLGVRTMPEISAKYASPDDYQQAALTLMQAFDQPTYDRIMAEAIGGIDPGDGGTPITVEEREDAEQRSAEAEYDAEEGGPEGVQVEVTDEGKVLIDGEETEPLP